MSVLDPKWRYTPSHSTDIRKRIAAELRRLAEIKKADEEKKAAEEHKVETLFRKRA